VRTADLFSRLAKYRPRPLKSSLEDFVTELVGYALENEPAISRAVGNFLLSSTNEAPTRDFKVCTQEYTQSDNVKLKGWRLDWCSEDRTAASSSSRTRLMPIPIAISC
jgi:hypothetical protein